MATDIEVLYRVLRGYLTTAAANSSALPDIVNRNRNLRDIFGDVDTNSKAYLNLVDDDATLFETIIGPGDDYQDEFGQRAVIEFIVRERDDDTRDRVFAQGLADIAVALRASREHPMLGSLDIFPPERANLSTGPLPGVKAARITVEVLFTAPDMLGNVLAERITAEIEPFVMTGELDIERGNVLVGALDPFIAASQLAILLEAQLSRGVDSILSAGEVQVRLTADSAPGIADIIGSGDADLDIAVTGAGWIGDIQSSGTADVPQVGFGASMTLDPILGSGDVDVDLVGVVSGLVEAVSSSSAVFTNPGANLMASLDPFLGVGAADLLVAGDGVGALDPFLSVGQSAVTIEATSAGALAPILASAQAGQPQTVLDGGGVIAPILSGGDASIVIVGLASGALDPFLSTSAAVASVAGDAALGLDPFISAGAAAVDIAGDAAPSIDPILSQGQAVSLIAGESSMSVEPIISASDVDVLAAIAGTPSLDDFLSAGDAGVLIAGSSAGQLGAFLGTGNAAVGGSSNEAETDALIARMTVAPVAARETLINDLIAGLKADGSWALLDILKIYKAHDQQASLLDWKGSNADSTPGGGHTFTVDQGWSVPGGGFNTNYNAAVDGVQFTNSVGHYGVWANAVPDGSVMLSGSAAIELYRHAPGNHFWLIGNTFGIDTTSNGAGNGHYVGSVTGGNLDCAFNGVDFFTGTTSADNLHTNQANAQLGFSGYSLNPLVFHAGAGLSQAQITSLYNRLNAFLSAF